MIILMIILAAHWPGPLPVLGPLACCVRHHTARQPALATTCAALHRPARGLPRNRATLPRNRPLWPVVATVSCCCCAFCWLLRQDRAGADTPAVWPVRLDSAERAPCIRISPLPNDGSSARFSLADESNPAPLQLIYLQPKVSDLLPPHRRVSHSHVFATASGYC